MNHPWTCPEDIEFRPRPLDPEWDDVPEPLPVYRFVETGTNCTYRVYGEEARDERMADLRDDQVPFVCEFTGEWDFDPDAII